jgi:hypothetical protein
MHDDDKSTKWLIQHHGDAILRLAGVRDIAAWTPLQAEPVQPRRLPDGLLEVHFRGQPRPSPFVLESFQLLGGKKAMSKLGSPILQELKDEWTQEAAREDTIKISLLSWRLASGLIPRPSEATSKPSRTMRG